MEKIDALGSHRKKVIVANPRGFCAGVTRAIDAVESALEVAGSPVYVRRAIVHNSQVIKELEQRGAVFVREIEEIPIGAVAILSAHGSAASVRSAAQARQLRIVDAVCPLVSKVHAEVRDWHKAGRHILLIGHEGHPEVVGTIGQIPAGAITVISRPEELETIALSASVPVAYAVQTTFAVRDSESVIKAIKTSFSDVAGPRTSDICYATTNRQQAIERIAPNVDIVLVVGDTMSSNAKRLVEVAEAAGAEAMLVADQNDLPWGLLGHLGDVGLTAAASTPERLVRQICHALADRGYLVEEQAGEVENVSFRAVSLRNLAEPDFSRAIN